MLNWAKLTKLTFSSWQFYWNIVEPQIVGASSRTLLITHGQALFHLNWERTFSFPLKNEFQKLNVDVYWKLWIIQTHVGSVAITFLWTWNSFFGKFQLYAVVNELWINEFTHQPSQGQLSTGTFDQVPCNYLKWDRGTISFVSPAL